MKRFCAIAVLVCFVGVFAVHATERSAGTNRNALPVYLMTMKAFVNALQERINVISGRVDKIAECGNDEKIYAPEHANSDANGCLDLMGAGE